MSDAEKNNGHHAGAPTGYGASSGYGPTPSLRTIANPAPLGLFSFASTTLILSLVNVQARGVTTPNVVIGMALFVGGLCQFMAGMWEFACGNTFGATAFTSYGGFWLSYATIFIPGSGVLSAYENESELHSALGFYLAVWFIFTAIMTVGALRSNLGLVLLFFFLTMTFMFLMIGEYIANVNIVKAGGGLGILTAFIAYYVGAANLFSRDSSYVALPLVPLRRTA